MMLPLNLNLQLNATPSALWANDSTLEILQHIFWNMINQNIKRKGKEKQDPDFLSSGGGRALRTCCWRRRWALRTCTCDDLSTTTHPLQQQSSELDRQGPGATECVLVLAQFLSSGKGSALRTCCWRRRWAPRVCTWWSVYDYTSPSVVEFRARQARTRRYWVCVSPRSVSTSWSGFWLFLHPFLGSLLDRREGSPFWEGTPLLERASPFGEGVPFLRGSAPLERARPFWEGIPLLEGHAHFDLVGEKGRAPFERARPQCHIEKLNLYSIQMV